MADKERKPLPAVLLIILALLGITSLQTSTISIPESKSAAGRAPEAKSSSAATPSHAPSAHSSAHPMCDAEILEPLLAHFRSQADEATSLDDAFERTGTHPRALRCLVAAVPDPVQTTLSHRFDEWLAAIQRGCESDGFVLAGFRIPWESAPAHSTDTSSGAPASALPSSSATKVGQPPGLLLFRDTALKNGITPLLAVFLVPETPTLGLDRAALLESLKLAEKWDDRNRGPCQRKHFNILGPCFSGSQESLKHVLKAHCNDPRIARSFQVISGSATIVDKETLQKCVGAPHSVCFSATVHHSKATLAALLDYLGVEREPIALLTEGSTGAGQQQLSSLQGSKSGGMRGAHEKSGVIFYPFPSHISRIRGYYEKRGLLGDHGSQAFRSAERLTIPFDETGNPVDIPATVTPGYTTAIDELALNETLSDIARRGIRKIGILATDPLDIVFLARAIVQFRHDVQLFTTQSQLIYAHTQNIADLRGMLVVSTYSLYPPNQCWSYPNLGDTLHCFFTSEGAQGTYNATVAHMDMIGNPKVSPRFLEYGAPFIEPDAGEPAQDRQRARQPVDRIPPIWISMVGNHGLFPVRAVCLGEEELPEMVKGHTATIFPYIYRHTPKPEEFNDLRHPDEQHQARSFDRKSWVSAMFRPELREVWPVVFWVLSLGIAVLVVFVVRADSNAIRVAAQALPSSELWRWLRLFQASSEKQPRANEAESVLGPGPYLVAALLFCLLAYLALTAPLFLAVQQVPWLAQFPPQTEVRLSMIASAVSGLAAAAIVLSVLIRAFVVGDRLEQFAGVVGNNARMRGRSAAAFLRKHATMPWLLFVLAALTLTATLLLRSMTEPKQGSTQERCIYSDLTPSARDEIFRLSRLVTIPSGVSPLLSYVFLASAGLVWSYSQLKRRYLFHQLTPMCPISAQAGQNRVEGDEEALQEICTLRQTFDKLIQTPARTFLSRYWHLSIVVAACTVFFLSATLEPSFTSGGQSPGGSVVDKAVCVMFAILFVILVYHMLHLVTLWRLARDIMTRVTRTPLVTALDRIPERVARWLKEPPRNRIGRFELIQRQARSLADLSEAEQDAVRRELAQRIGSRITSTEWHTLISNLRGLKRGTVPGVRDQLRKYLLAYWKPLSPRMVFPNNGEAKCACETSLAGLSGEVHNVALALNDAPLVTPRTTSRLDEWIREAEDLLALFFMRWLAVALAQIWTLVGFLVIGSMSLLLAINSYPFPYQDAMMDGLGLLIAAIVVIVLTIVLGFNRDELISRISNTAPNQLTLDQHLIGSLLTYVVPLVGMLAALSFDVSDTLRSLVDPLLRHMG